MAFRHGIYARELPTKVVPPIVSDTGLPVVFGVAPVHTASEPAEPNKPYLIYSYEEGVRYFGYSENFEDYGISEMLYTQFALYGVAPVVLVNVLDVKKHKTGGQSETFQLVDGVAELTAEEIIPDTVVIKKQSNQEKLKRGEDFLLSITSAGKIKVAAVSEKMTAETMIAEYDKVNPKAVTKQDIIGGIDISTGKKTGLELINEVYPRFGKIPGSIVAPGFSHDSEVATLMASKANKINGIFRAQALIDAPANLKYSELRTWKNKSNVVETREFIGYPKVKLGEKIFRFSTQLAGVIQATDERYRGIPYKSPSNELIRIDATVNDKAEEMFLGQDEGNYLNSQGIMTAINYNGWKTWGNRTAAYPGTSDVKDSFIPIRRMFDWTMNTLALTFWSKIDNPVNKRLIETITDSANLWLNGLTAEGALYGGRVVFLVEDNPVTDLMDGKIRFHFYLTPPSPAEEIEFIQEYDVNYVQEFIKKMGQ